jgi:selenocysteine-specific elongation factor
MRSIVIGTAGHVDHGKSTLIKALTGTDPDRLKEEKERGITIDLGFASLPISPDLHASIVDVPGHERFVKNMVAGTGGIDLVLLVVAADEGVMPQTREHVDICALLGIQRGVVALTKIDLVSDAAWKETVVEDFRKEFSGTFLEKCPLVPVSSTTGEGLPELRRVLLEIGQTVPERVPDALPFLPIDRAFSIRGFGTVVTGTLVQGSLSLGQFVDIEPDESGKLRGLKIRGLQSHGREQETVAAGQRVAVNLLGVERSQIARGQVLVQNDTIRAKRHLEGTFIQVKGAPLLRPRMQAILHVGTMKTNAHLRLIGDVPSQPGEVFVDLRCRDWVVVLPGQHFILRGFNPIQGRGTTIGGGKILAVRPARRNKKEKTQQLEELEILRSGSSLPRLGVFLETFGVTGAKEQDLRVRSGLSQQEVTEGLKQLLKTGKGFLIDREHGLWVGGSATCELSERTVSILNDFHRDHPLLPGMTPEELRSQIKQEIEPRIFRLLLEELARQTLVVLEGDRVRLPKHRVALNDSMTALQQQLADIYRKAKLAPPRMEQLATDVGKPVTEIQEVVSHLCRSQVLVHISGDMYVAADAILELRKRLFDFLSKHAEITTQDFKTLVGGSRKHVIPLAEYFDREKLTMRVGEKRVLRNR